MVKKYNINELLDKKKELESQIKEFSVTEDSLTYTKDKFIDLNSKYVKEVELKPKITLKVYIEKYIGITGELAKIKSAIAKFNAKHTCELLVKREKVRVEIMLLDEIKLKLPTGNKIGKDVVRTNSEGIALEMKEYEILPMFSIDSLDKMKNELSAEERKLNTQIQKINLDANLELK